MTSTYLLNFTSPPSLWGIYPRVLTARKPAFVAAGGVVPRIEARLQRVRVDAANLRRYREVCGCAPSLELPLAYPHVLASALHLAMLASERFPVGLLGLVHVANRIEQFGPLDPDAGGELSCWLEGHEETSRGQQFELHTTWTAGGGVLWRERCSFLARAQRPSKPAAATAASPASPASPARPARPASPASQASAAASAGAANAATGMEADDGPMVTSSFRAPAGLGRRYGPVSGDVNPIHMADITARAFGFRAAIAHGMWSLARCVAEVEGALPAGKPRQLEARFRLPVFLPAWLSLQQARGASGVRFALLDSQGQQAHVVGSLRPAA